MTKYIARLAVAIVLVATPRNESGSALAKESAAKIAPHRASSRTTPHSKSQSSGGKPATLRRARKHRSRRRWSPWRVSSFGDPAAFDSAAGEDPQVRSAALEAMGNWNGSVVVVAPNNGRILSIVNQRLALESAFTPCSTFKPIVALAALKEDIITPETDLWLGRRTRINLTEALAHSNNPFFARLGQMIGFRRLSGYAHEFGLGEKAGWNIPGEVPGKFPAEIPKQGGVGLVASHGFEMEVTLLQMAAVVSAIANGGTLFELQYPRSEDEVANFEPRVKRRLADFAPYIPQVKAGLAATVLYGTGHWAYDPALDVYGKTGTCSEDGARLGWFISYAGQEEPKYVVIVLLRGGQQVEGPHAAEIAGHLYHGLLQRGATAAQARPSLPADGK